MAHSRARHTPPRATPDEDNLPGVFIVQDPCAPRIYERVDVSRLTRMSVSGWTTVRNKRHSSRRESGTRTRDDRTERRPSGLLAHATIPDSLRRVSIGFSAPPRHLAVRTGCMLLLRWYWTVIGKHGEVENRFVAIGSLLKNGHSLCRPPRVPVALLNGKGAGLGSGLADVEPIALAFLARKMGRPEGGSSRSWPATLRPVAASDAFRSR